MSFLPLAFVTLVPIFYILPPAPSVASCDLLERNSVYDDEGRVFLDQVIFWRWEPALSAHVAEGWRYTRDGSLRHTPTGWRWEQPGLTVEAPRFLRTWTQEDREVMDRAAWPVERRRWR